MSKLCSAYLSTRTFSLPRFGSKREETVQDVNVVKPDELYGFFPKKQGGLCRTGTLPGRIKPQSENETKLRKVAAQRLTRHRSLLPGEKNNVGKNPLPLPPRQPVVQQTHVPHPVVEAQTPARVDPRVDVKSRRALIPQSRDASPVRNQIQANVMGSPSRKEMSPSKLLQKQKVPASRVTPWGCATKLNTSLNSSGNSLNDSGIDSGIDSLRHTDTSSRTTDQCSRVSYSSYGSLYPSPHPSPPLYGLNCRLQNASISRPANVPLLVCRDYQPSVVEQAKMRVISGKPGEIVNALYRTNEWVMVRTSQNETGFIPFAYTELLDTRRLSQDFTQQHPEGGAPLWRPSSHVKTTLPASVAHHSDTESHATECHTEYTTGSPVAESQVSGAVSDSLSHSLCMGPHHTSCRKYDPDLSVLEDCANVEFFRTLEPRLARDRNPVMMLSQLSMVPHIGSDVSYDDVYYDVSGDFDDDVTDYEGDENFLDVSIDSTCTVSSVFTVTDTGIQLTVLFTYNATQENDLSVSKGDIVLELNNDDPDWTWVRSEDGEEGFLPSTYVVNLRKLNLDPRAPTTYL